MIAATAKKIAERNKLELYYDTQWKVWALIDPSCVSDQASDYLSPGEFKSMDRSQFETLVAYAVTKHQIVLTD